MKQGIRAVLAALFGLALCLLLCPTVSAEDKLPALEVQIDFRIPSPEENTGPDTRDRETGIYLAEPSSEEQNDLRVSFCMFVEPNAEPAFCEPAHPYAPTGSDGEILSADPEQEWEERLQRKDVLFLFTLEENGASALERAACGCLELRCRLRDTNWDEGILSGRSLVDREWRELGRSGSREPAEECANLRLRCWLRQEENKLLFCRELLLMKENGEVVWCFFDRHEAVPGEQYALRLNTRTMDREKAEEEGSALEVSPADQPTQSAIRTVERSWTWVSSDGRPLWRVTVEGLFCDGQCLEASGYAEALSEDWRVEDAVFCPSGADAAAVVTVSRRVLGISVARQSYEFRVSPGET